MSENKANNHESRTLNVPCTFPVVAKRLPPPATSFHQPNLHIETSHVQCMPSRYPCSPSLSLSLPSSYTKLTFILHAPFRLRTSCQLEFRGKRNRENMWLFRDRVVYLSSQLTNSIGDTWGYIDRINCVEAKLTSSSRAYTQQSTTERRVYSPGIARKNWEREGSDGNKATK